MVGPSDNQDSTLLNPSGRNAGLRTLALVTLAWVVVAACQTWLFWVAQDSSTAILTRSLKISLVVAIYWAAVTVVILQIPRHLPWVRGRRFRAMAVLLVGLLICAAGEVLCRQAAQIQFMPRLERQSFPAAFLGYLDRNAFQFLLITAIAYALFHLRQQKEAEAKAARLNGELAQARLELLQLQLHPHFLFNTIHSISELVHHNPARARQAIGDLQTLVHAVAVQEPRLEWTLGEELALLDKYVNIQKMRFGDRLTCVSDASAEARSCRVPAMVLQPIVENAIQHGLARRQGMGRVVIQADTAGSALRITVADNGAGLPAQHVVHEGVGLGNTKRRLEAQYGRHQQFHIDSSSAGGTTVTIELPARPGNLAQGSQVASTDTTLPAPPPLRWGAFALIGWGGAAVAWLIESVLFRNVIAGSSVAFSVSLADSLGNAALLLAATPVAILVARRYAASRAPFAVRAGGVVLAGIAVAAGIGFLRTVLLAPPGEPILGIQNIVNGFWDCTVFITIVALAHAAHLHLRANTGADFGDALARDLAAIRLDILRRRVQPEFVISTLGTVSTLSHTDPGGADRLSTALGDMLRGLLTAGRGSLFALRDEIALVRSYLKVRALRGDGSWTLAADLPAHILDVAIPVLTLVTPVHETFRPNGNRTRGGEMLVSTREKPHGNIIELVVEGEILPCQ